MLHDIHGVMAMRPDTGAIEKAWLYENHFGRGHHAVRFDSDGMNAPFHSERNIPWEPYRLTELDRAISNQPEPEGGM